MVKLYCTRHSINYTTSQSSKINIWMNFILTASSDDMAPELRRSTHVNVIGEPRLEPVRIPAYIKAGRPGEMPNNKVT